MRCASAVSPEGAASGQATAAQAIRLRRAAAASLRRHAA